MILMAVTVVAPGAPCSSASHCRTTFAVRVRSRLVRALWNATASASIATCFRSETLASPRSTFSAITLSWATAT